MFLRLLKEGFLFAFNSVIINKLRTFLSLFGITIGIVSIISVFTVLDWMEKSIKDSIATLGDNTVYVHKWPWSFDPNLNWWDMIQRPAPSPEDYEVLSKKSNAARAVCYLAMVPRNVNYKGNSVSDVYIWSATHEIDRVRNFEIEKGRYFSQNESASGKPVAIIGCEVARKLFVDLEPVGKEVSIAGFKTLIIGVFKKEGKGGISDSGMDEVMLIPMTFGGRFINYRLRWLDSQVMLRGKKEVSINELSDEVTMILRSARRLRPGEADNFSVNQASLLTQGFESVFSIINIAGWFIGGFSILVGGFGIANIMFVSVRERTSIIGIQMALGAKRRFILLQFLIESVLLSILGGILGLLIIFLGTLMVNYLYNLDMFLTAGNVILAIVISGTIGVVAGFAPASAASKMNPVEAIGYSF